jgi:hypothetical protein
MQIIQEAILNELNKETLQRYKVAAKEDLGTIRKVLDQSRQAPDEERVLDMFPVLGNAARDPKNPEPGDSRWIAGTRRTAQSAGFSRTRGLVKANARLRGMGG